MHLKSVPDIPVILPCKYKCKDEAKDIITPPIIEFIIMLPKSNILSYELLNNFFNYLNNLFK